MTNRRQNLIPMQIVDKNGRRTTVHRRDETTRPSNAFGLPAVSLSKPSPTAQYKAGLERLSNSGTMIGQRLLLLIQKTKLNRDIKIRMLDELHEDTLSILDKSSLRDEYNFQNLLLDSCMRYKSLLSLNNAAVIADVADECDDLHRKVFHTYVDGLQMYRNIKDPYIDWSLASDDEKEVPKALVRAAIGLNKPYSQVNMWVNSKPRHITSNLLADLIEKRPQDVQRIIALVNDREPELETEQDIANLEGLLELEAENPLTSGLL